MRKLPKNTILKLGLGILISDSDLPLHHRNFLGGFWCSALPCTVLKQGCEVVGYLLPSVQWEGSVDVGTARSIQHLMKGLDELKR